ncbi:MAG: type VI secretion system lipoprotein TssJ [Azoarcus sp.]|jgi:type VI secretion system protein VasD|nr:type VI secretion system lipoprotein TssJ [Azoarcus sp.]
MRNAMSWRAVGLLAAVSVALSACAGKSKEAPARPEEAFSQMEPMSIPGPVEYALKAGADAEVNRDAKGRPLSIVVRIYQLKDRNAFARLGFDAFVSGQRDAELFSGEMVAVNEMVLLPGTTQELTDRLSPEAKYVGVAAFFRSPDARRWRFLVDGGSVVREGLNFTVKDCYFDAVQPAAEPLPGQQVGNAPECGATLRR